VKTVIEMAREAGILEPIDLLESNQWKQDTIRELERFAELVRADEAEKYKWDVHSCGPTCDKKGCVAVREAVAHERAECAKVCDDFERIKWESVKDIVQNGGRLAFAGPMHCAAAIRARGEA
jgi:hypothetical protein